MKRTWYYFALFFLLVSCGWAIRPLVWANSVEKADRQTGADQTPTVAELVQQASDTNTSFESRYEVFERLDLLSKAQQLEALIQLLQVPDEEIATVSAIELVRNGSESLMPPVQQKLPNLSLINQARILGEMLTQQALRPDAAYTSIARSALQYSLSTEAKQHDVLDIEVLSSNAALVVANAKNAQDQKLLRTALARFPKQPSLWLANSLLQSLSSQERVIAQKFFSDTKTNPQVREAVAIALASSDQKAAQWFSNKVALFIKKYGSWGEQNAKRLAKNGQADPRLSYVYAMNLGQVGRLRFLRSALTQQITLKGVASSNSEIREPAILVAAEHYPSALIAMLKNQRKSLTKAEYENALVLVAAKHPQHEKQVRAEVKDYMAIAARLKQKTIVGSFSGAEAYLGL